MISGFIQENWLFYAIGLTTDAKWLARTLKTRIASFFCIVAVIVVLLLKQFGFVTAPDAFATPFSDCLWDLDSAQLIVARLFCTLLFLGCIAPISSYGGIVADLLTQLGQRTLYGYWINAVLVMLLKEKHTKVLYVLTSMDEDQLPSHPAFVHLIVFLSASASCCPLSEWLFRWVVSPQWVFDGGAKAISLMKTLRSKQQGSIGS